jgi:hypothetical protein
MRPPEKFARIVDRKRYDVSTATLIAGDDYWDGHNFERSGRNTFLYRTPLGNYFVVYLTCWQGERDTLEPVNQGDAILAYEGNEMSEIGSLSEHYVEYAEAFPGVTVEEA